MTGQDNSGKARLLLVGAAMVLLALGGCGRKGGLDLPPVGAGMQPTSAAPQATPSASTQVSPLGPFEPAPEEKPMAAPGVKKRIILDPILD